METHIHILSKIAGFANKIAICLLLSLGFGITAVAQEPLIKSEYSYRQYTTQDGLPENSVAKLYLDNKGFIWTGTVKGFAQFDGFGFKKYLVEQGYNIFHLDETREGKIRAFAGKDACIVENDSLRFVHYSDSLDIYENNCISLPNNYYIYKKFFESPYEPTYLMESVNDTSMAVKFHTPYLDYLSNNAVYLDTMNNYFYFSGGYRSQAWTRIYDINTNEEIVYNDSIQMIYFFNHSHLGLLGFGFKGIYQINKTKIEMLFPFQFNLMGFKAAELSNGDLMIKDYQHIWRFRNMKMELLYENSAASLWDMISDKDDNLWLGTDAGLVNFYRFNFKNHSIPGHVIRDIAQDNEGNYWFAGVNKDIFRLSGNNLEKMTFPEKQEIKNRNPIKIFSYKEKVYFLFTGGIMMWDKKRQFHWADVPVGNYYSSIISFGDYLLVCHPGALFQMDLEGNVIEEFSYEQLKQISLYGLEIDKRGRRVVGGMLGLSVIDGDSVRLIADENTKYSQFMCSDKDKNLWIGSQNRLNLFQGDTVITVHSFQDDYITGLLPVDNNHMVITTLAGLYLFDINKYLASKEIQLLFYNQNNGMNGIGIRPGKLILDKGGIVWMTTINEIISFDPQSLLRNVPSPNMIIQKAEVSTDNVKWNITDDFDVKHLAYKYKNIRFSFIGLNYSAVNNVRYHYRLKGFQNEWSESIKNREITFNNLPPADYVFEIYADSGTDESRSEMQSFAFSIKPAFWQTVWFLFACIAFLMLASAGVALYVQRRRNKALLEKLRVEKELNELRISSIRLKAIPHFNANVLSAIEYYIANRTKKEAMHILGIYSDFTFKTLSEVDKAARPLSEELAYVKMYLDLEKIRFLDKFDFRIEVEDEVDENVQLPNMILHTYCENAVKHGLMPRKSGGLLTIRVSQRDQTVCIDVEDNGVGRTAAAQNPYVHSTKQGLSILNRQIEIYNRFNREKINQQIKDLIEGSIACGTRFTVEVPVNFEYVN